MLVLSRKQKQEIHIGQDIKVTVLGIRGGVVKLGIEAPSDVHILRGELPSWYEAGSKHELEVSLT
ncbi:MAG: carbon storage regulator [Planctomycetota bacterium]|nr:MAG: carbon storage regulator [Planctomycetota bacterium]